jgi:hypothetical protein
VLMPVAGTLVQSQPWESTLRYYKELEDRNQFFQPMRRLVEHVASQPYATFVFSTPLMHALLVARHAELKLGHDVLRVQCALDGTTVRFDFQEQPLAKPMRWECSDAKIVETFETFLRKARWIAP